VLPPCEGIPLSTAWGRAWLPACTSSLPTLYVLHYIWNLYRILQLRRGRNLIGRGVLRGGEVSTSLKLPTQRFHRNMNETSISVLISFHVHILEGSSLPSPLPTPLTKCNIDSSRFTRVRTYPIPDTHTVTQTHTHSHSSGLFIGIWNCIEKC